MRACPCAAAAPAPAGGPGRRRRSPGGRETIELSNNSFFGWVDFGVSVSFLNSVRVTRCRSAQRLCNNTLTEAPALTTHICIGSKPSPVAPAPACLPAFLHASRKLLSRTSSSFCSVPRAASTACTGPGLSDLVCTLTWMAGSRGCCTR